eukprot:8633986-Prorocentrum_lima.AAC.1
MSYDNGGDLDCMIALHVDDMLGAGAAEAGNNKHNDNQPHAQTRNDNQPHAQTHNDNRPHAQTHNDNQPHAHTHNENRPHAQTHSDNQPHGRNNDETEGDDNFDNDFDMNVYSGDPRNNFKKRLSTLCRLF